MADKTFEILDGFVSRANSNIKAANFDVIGGDLTVKSGDVSVNNGSNSVFHIDTSAERIEFGTTAVAGDKVTVGGRLRATEFVGNGALITNLDVANIPDLTDNFLSSQDADSYESGGILSIANSSTLQVTSGSIKLSDSQTLVFGNGGDAILDLDSTSGDFIISANAVTTRLIGEFIPSRSTTGEQIAIGSGAGLGGQGARGVAIGSNAAHSSQGLYAVALGWNSGLSAQGNYSIAIGQDAGELNQNASCIAIGPQAASNGQSQYSIAIGRSAGNSNQGANSIAIGYFAGYGQQGIDSIAIGRDAGRTSQSNNAIGIGYEAGETDQQREAIAIGYQAGALEQGRSAIAIGMSAGEQYQNNYAIAIGYSSAVQGGQGFGSVSIGTNTATRGQGRCSVALGPFAGSVGYPHYSPSGAGGIHINAQSSSTSMPILSNTEAEVLTTNNHILIENDKTKLQYRDTAYGGTAGSNTEFGGNWRFLAEISNASSVPGANTSYSNSVVSIVSRNANGSVWGQSGGQCLSLVAENTDTGTYPYTYTSRLHMYNAGYYSNWWLYDDTDNSPDSSSGVGIKANGIWFSYANNDPYVSVSGYEDEIYCRASEMVARHTNPAGLGFVVGGQTNIGGNSYGPLYLKQQGVAHEGWTGYSNHITTSAYSNLHIGSVKGYNGYDYLEKAISVIPQPGTYSTQTSYVILYYNNSTRLTTTNAGVTVTGTLSQTSALRYKDNVQDIEDGSLIDNLRPITYNAKDGTVVNMPGLIADEVANSLPEVVSYNSENEVEGLSYDRLIPHMIKKIQELTQEIEILKGNA